MKKFVGMIFLLLMIIKIPVLAQKYSNYNFDFITLQEINTRIENVKVTGSLPHIDKFKSKTFENQLNQKINLIYEKKIAEAISKNVKSLKINYKVKAEKNIISILLNFLGDKNDLETINFNLKTCSFVSISDIIGPNGTQIVNKIIHDETIKTPEKYNLNFNGIDNDHNFFVDGDNLVVPFNEYELSSAIKGIQTVTIKISGVKNKIINAKNYYTTKPYDLKMIPLRNVCEAFDFEVVWHEPSASVKIVNDKLTATALVNRNNYMKNNEAPQTLESAPQIKNNQTYVPISFFVKYANLFYSISDDNNLIFSQY